VSGGAFSRLAAEDATNVATAGGGKIVAGRLTQRIRVSPYEFVHRRANQSLLIEWPVIDVVSISAAWDETSAVWRTNGSCNGAG
jgi:hypothetical protein